MDASFPNSTVYEPLAVQFYHGRVFFRWPFPQPLALAGMREEFLYGLIVDLLLTGATHCICA